MQESKTVIYESDSTLIFWQEESNRKELVKLLKAEHPSQRQLLLLENELAVSQALANVEGVRTIKKKEKIGGKMALVMDYVEGSSLKSYLKSHQWYISEWLQKAINIVSLIRAVHAEGIIHRDINSNNLIINDKKGSIHLIDLELAIKNGEKTVARTLNRDKDKLSSQGRLEGTLAYISPEQTGRLNKTVDSRSDLYSLGVLLYEMIVGSLPFDIQDDLELIHAHLAIEPVPPHLREKVHTHEEIPVQISLVIMKLLEKEPDNRYSSAQALLEDLKLCFTQWEENKAIPAFPLEAERSRFNISGNLYGRDGIITALETVFDRVSDGSRELCIITGAEGSGKTRLANSMESYVVGKEGFFIRGRFDHTVQTIPYSGWITAFDNFVNRLLTEDIYQLEYWKTTINEAVGDNGKVLTEVIPNLELIIGTQPDLTPQGVLDSHNRFMLVTRNFVRAISKKKHPLAIFLDDFQWADEASKNLLQSLMLDAGNEYLWVIMSFRGEAISEEHLLYDMTDSLEGEQVSYQAFHLENLSFQEVTHLLGDTLDCQQGSCKELAEVIYQKTLGNPFFTVQMLESIYEKNLLTYVGKKNKEINWSWDLEAIQQLNVTENVVDMMAARIQQLPEETQKILILGACEGNHFHADILASLYEKEEVSIFNGIQPAIEQGLIVLIQEKEKLYRFTHSRIRDAVYSLANQEETPKVHKKIGDALYTKAGEPNPDTLSVDAVFDLVKHWNRGLVWITGRKEKKLIAKFNLVAGIMSSSSGAYESAIHYLTIGMKLVEDYGWQNTYKLNLELFNTAAESAYLSGDYVSMEKWVNKLIEQTVTIPDKIPAYEIKILSLISREKLGEAVETGLKILKQLGVDLPTKLSRFRLNNETRKIKFKLRGKTASHFLSLPEMSDDKMMAAMRMMALLTTPIQIIRPELTPFMIYRQIDIMLKEGISSYSPGALIGYGIFLTIYQKDPVKGFAYGKVGLELLRRFDSQEYLASNYILFYGALWPYKKHLKEVFEPLKEAFHTGMNNGDFASASYGIAQYVFDAFLLGVNLPKLEEELNFYTREIEQINQEGSLHYLQLGRQLVRKLRESSGKPDQLTTSLMSEEKLLEKFKNSSDQSALSTFYFSKLLLAYHFESYQTGLEALNEIQALSGSNMSGHTTDPNYLFFYCLIRLALYPEQNPDVQKAWFKTIKKFQEEVEFWSIHAPANYLHKFHLLEAEKLRVLGQEESARKHYERALYLSKENDFLHDEVLAWVLTGKFYRARGQQFLAETYLEQAVNAYQRWGAYAVVNHLRNRYPRYINNSDSPGSDSRKSTQLVGSLKGESIGGLDYQSINKASQTLAGEVVLSNLLTKMMRIVIENAGATRGAFIENRKDNLWVLAEGDLSKGIEVGKAVAVSQVQNIPYSIINYVARTNKVLVLDSAGETSMYSSDVYLNKMNPASLLCYPITHKGSQIAIIYLENRLTQGAFNSERKQVLDILSAQIAISIENARLYEGLDEKVKERTRQLNTKNSELAETISKLQTAQSQLVQAEKMASLGQLTAGIAHEINNPINFISGNILPLQRDIQEIKALLMKIYEVNGEIGLEEAFKNWKEYWEELETEYLFEEIEELMSGIQIGANRTKDIVLGLKNFSRLDEDSFKLADVHEGLDSTLFLLKNHFKERISVEKDYGELQRIECLPGKVNQVFMNILNNAADAIQTKAEELKDSPEEKGFSGEIHIHTKQLVEEVMISFKDNGYGMTEEVKNRIFEPFFTTKDVGAGTGLGMAIVYGIIEQHKGRIEVDSNPMVGTELRVYLPVKQLGET
ncbi:MAG: AAA family ATPase [Bacteroidota bacterium]